MHHSQLEYLVAVQNLQRQDRGAKGYEVAEYLNVSPAYAVKLNVYAESQGYIRRDKACTIRLTLLGEQVMEEYLMLLQKTFTENCITKKVKKNRGEMAKYFIANNHVPIVSSEMFKKVQREMSRRRGKRQTSDKGITSLGKYSGKFALSQLLVCGECGSPYKRVTWMKNGVSRKVWRCLSRVEHGKKFCTQSPALDETKLHAAICRGLTRLLENKEDVLEMIIPNLSCVMTGEDDVLESDTMENQIRYLRQQVDDNVQHLNSTEGDKSKYIEVIRQLNDKIAILQEQLEAKREKIAANPSLKAEIDEIRETLTNTELCFSQYDDIMIRRLVGLIRVTKDKSIVIYLKGGLSVTEAVE